ncbi:hypothetical protein ACXN5S_09725 [Pseudoroseicyclus sp. H15]
MPFTLSFLGVMLVTNSLAGTFSGEIDPAVLAAWGVSAEALRSGDLLRFVTATFLSHDLPMLLRQLIFAGVVLGMAEWRWGSWRTAALFFGIDLTSTLLLLSIVLLIPGLNHLVAVTDVGMSLGGFGLIGVLVASRRNAVLWLVAILGLVTVKFYAAPEPLADGGHVIALMLGVFVGIFRRRVPARGRQTGAASGRDDRHARQEDVPR